MKPAMVTPLPVSRHQMARYTAVIQDGGSGSSPTQLSNPVRVWSHGGCGTLPRLLMNLTISEYHIFVTLVSKCCSHQSNHLLSRQKLKTSTASNEYIKQCYVYETKKRKYLFCLSTSFPQGKICPVSHNSRRIVSLTSLPLQRPNRRMVFLCVCARG